VERELRKLVEGKQKRTGVSPYREAITSEPEDRNETEMEEEEEEEGPSGKSLRAVCKHMEEKCWKEDKMLIKLNKTTLKR